MSYSLHWLPVEFRIETKTPEALESAKQGLIAMATNRRRYIREAETRRISRMLSTKLCKV